MSKRKIPTTRATAEEMGEVLENIKKSFSEQIEQNVCDEQVIATLRIYIRKGEDKTIAKRYSGNKLLNLRNKTGFDVR